METKDKIYNAVKKIGRATTKQVAKKSSVSRATASKYLHILEGEGKVKKETQTPYNWWTVKRRK